MVYTKRLWDGRGTKDKSTLPAMKSLKNIGLLIKMIIVLNIMMIALIDFLFILLHTVAYATNVLTKLLLMLISSYNNVVNQWNSNNDSHLKL